MSLEPLVSVITPVYNGEAYLAECVDSVLAQTYQNWEYIIVNNCSKDRSLEIAREYAGRDNRIRVHDNEDFLSQFQNWNHAMRQMSPNAKYCKVVHADDWLFPECIVKMVAVAEQYPSVGIVGAYRLDEDRVTMDGLPYPSTIVPGHKLCRAVLLGGLHPFGSPSSLLLRSSVIRQRDSFYSESVLHADTRVCFDILQDHDYGFVHQVLTFTRRHNESISSLTHKFNTRRLAEIGCLLKYGPVFLDAQAYQARRKRVVENYYGYLGRCALERRGKAFWQYHRSELENLGIPIRRTKIAEGVLRALLDVRQAIKIIAASYVRRRSGDGSRTTPQQMGSQEDNTNWDNLMSTIVIGRNSDADELHPPGDGDERHT